MLLSILIGLIGAVIGAYLAHKRKGKLLDIIQYAGIYFIAFAIIGLIISTILVRTL